MKCDMLHKKSNSSVACNTWRFQEHLLLTDDVVNVSVWITILKH